SAVITRNAKADWLSICSRRSLVDRPATGSRLNSTQLSLRRSCRKSLRSLHTAECPWPMKILPPCVTADLCTPAVLLRVGCALGGVGSPVTAGLRTVAALTQPLFVLGLHVSEYLRNCTAISRY